MASHIRYSGKAVFRIRVPESSEELNINSENNVQWHLIAQYLQLKTTRKEYLESKE